MATTDSIKVTGIKFPDVEDQSKIDALTTILEAENGKGAEHTVPDSEESG